MGAQGSFSLRWVYPLFQEVLLVSGGPHLFFLLGFVFNFLTLSLVNNRGSVFTMNLWFKAIGLWIYLTSFKPHSSVYYFWSVPSYSQLPDSICPKKYSTRPFCHWRLSGPLRWAELIQKWKRHTVWDMRQKMIRLNSCLTQGNQCLVVDARSYLSMGADNCSLDLC